MSTRSTQLSLLFLCIAPLLLAACASTPDPQAQQARQAAWNRHRQAQLLIQRGEYHQATDILIRLWQDSTAPGAPYYYGNLLDSIRELAAEHPPARERFLELETDLYRHVRSNPEGRRAEGQWLDLNLALRNQATFVDFARVAAESPRLRKQLQHPPVNTFERLTQAGHYALAGELLPDSTVSDIYPRETPEILIPLEAAAEVAAGIITAPVVIPLGAIMVSSPGSGDGKSPPRPTQEQEAGRARQRLHHAAKVAAALTAANRHPEAAELRRRAAQRMGEQAAAEAFAQAAMAWTLERGSR